LKTARCFKEIETGFSLKQPMLTHRNERKWARIAACHPEKRQAAIEKKSKLNSLSRVLEK